MSELKTICALGSSYAAGPGIEPVDDPAAGRSARNYPHLLAERLGARLVDLSASGATTDTILHTPQTTMLGASFAPQIDGVPRHADLVTVTAGGNDLQFAGSMIAAAWRAHAPDDPITAMINQYQPSDGIPPVDAATVERVAAGLARITTEARRRAPEARVILVDYLTVLGDDTVAARDVPFPVEDLQALERVQTALRDAHILAAERSATELLSASGLSTGHAVGSTEPWVFGFLTEPQRTGASFHPNPAGMAAVAGALADLVDPRR